MTGVGFYQIVPIDEQGRHRSAELRGATTEGSYDEKTVKDIRFATRKLRSVEENIRHVLDGLKGASSTSWLCRCGIDQSLYYSFSKEFFASW